MKKCLTDGQGRSRLLERKSQAVRNVSHTHYLVFFSPLSELWPPSASIKLPWYFLLDLQDTKSQVSVESWWICSQKAWCKCRVQELNFANSCSGSEEGKKLFQRGSSHAQCTDRPILYHLKSVVTPWIQWSVKDGIWSFIYYVGLKRSSSRWELPKLQFKWPGCLRA